MVLNLFMTLLIQPLPVAFANSHANYYDSATGLHNSIAILVFQWNSPTTEQGVGNFIDKTSVMFQYLGVKLSFWFEILQGTGKILEPNNDIFSTFSKVLLARLFNECCRFDLFLMSWLSQMLRMYFKDNVDQI